MYLYTAINDHSDSPAWLVAAWPGLGREAFTQLVIGQLDSESIPNPDDPTRRLTLCEWEFEEGASWLDGLAPVEGLTWAAMIERAAYTDLVYTYPGTWIELEPGAREPIPAEFRHCADYSSPEEEAADGYDITDPKHPDHYRAMTAAWDEREKGAVA